LGCRPGWVLLAMHAKTPSGVGKERSISEQTDSFAFAFVVVVDATRVWIYRDRSSTASRGKRENCRRRCYRDAAPVN
jgi:hypothetical protein